MKNRNPDLSDRPFSLTTERRIDLPPEVLFQAWTQKFDVWFVVPVSVLMEGGVDTPFFFETEFEGNRHPHYGRFLRLEPDRLAEITWVTGAGGTESTETVVTVDLLPQDEGTLLKLTHTSFADEDSRDGHEEAWPMVLEQKMKEDENKALNFFCGKINLRN